MLAIPAVPVLCNVLWATREEAVQAARGDIALAFCPQCGHVWNTIFDPSLMTYNQTYENSLHFSPTFQSYAQSLAKRLVEEYDIRNKDIIEIGSGQGDFLISLCELGNNRGVGFDPSYNPDQENHQTSERVSFVQDMYSEQYADYPADVVCSRHVLEHIPLPATMLQSVRKTIGDRSSALLFFEVPNALFMFHDLSIYDIIYEHCSYFSPGSLSYVFAANGYHVQEVREEFNGQFLSITANSSNTNQSEANSSSWEGLAQMRADIEVFANHYRQKINDWNARLATFSQAGEKVVVWGAGSKGIMFLNTLQNQHQIEYVVDINPRKQGRYITGTGQEIVEPVFLQSYQPDVVIIMNPIYQNEIRQMLEHVGVSANIMAV
jgi:hypothetical protein